MDHRESCGWRGGRIRGAIGVKDTTSIELRFECYYIQLSNILEICWRVWRHLSLSMSIFFLKSQLVTWKTGKDQFPSSYSKIWILASVWDLRAWVVLTGDSPPPSLGRRALVLVGKWAGCSELGYNRIRLCWDLQDMKCPPWGGDIDSEVTVFSLLFKEKK